MAKKLVEQPWFASCMLVMGGLLLANISAACAATTDPTFCANVERPAQLMPFDDAKATLVSLWYARNAAQRGAEFELEVKKEKNESFGTVMEMMRTTKLATNDFICAKRSIEPFTDADDPIQTIARFLGKVYDAHIDINHRLLDVIKKLGRIDEADLMDEMSSLQVERGQRFADLVAPTSLALMLLVDTKRPDQTGKTTRLIVTKAQKQALLQWANQHFVEFAAGTPEERWTDPAKAAHLYFNIFEGRKCSDE